ncbi:type IV secretion system protein [Chitinimonas sp. BJB300]|uniref:type IV secretion system protein n=1 Tax=Chitinimonas sp. BJB300 TaxID=1559339 RepID=UPI000C0F5EC4|nr:type IV secretion system protein [Chitinimonas sp. BJB300]PHV12221.1 hypothetical protein CSQ89_06745 [Chitinimonas sp. BJB300]TSJ85196.1 type IV secretion system protein [Chitinimonas sp. BJB300]
MMPKPTVLNDPKASEWDYSTNNAAAVDRNRWFIAFLIMASLCCLLAVAWIMRGSMEQVIPVILHMDYRNGTVVSVSNPRSKDDLTPSEREAIAMERASTLVMARETWDKADQLHRDALVHALSSEQTWQSYQADEKAENSRAVKFADKYRVEVELGTVTPLPDDPNTIQVRFVTTVIDFGNGQRGQRQYKLATISSTYASGKLDYATALLNPLNWRSKRYRVDKDPNR